MDEILKGLNSDQRAAVLHDHEAGGPLLVLAGAGSGKTSVLTRRIQHRIACGAEPSSILALTFTAKAAGEMRDRVEALFPKAGVRLCTFHALALSLLRERFGARFGYELVGFAVPPEPHESVGSDFLSDLVSAGLSARAFKREALFAASLPKKLREKTEVCRRKVLASGRVSFEDLIHLSIFLLENFAEARDAVRAKFREIMVDEYQDINPAQYRLVRAILGERKALFAVGDDDQAIYGFRGADIGNILRFRRDFPESRLIRLEWNYRSVPNVLALANRIFTDKPLELRKTLRAGNPRRDALFLENRKPEVIASPDPVVELERLIGRMRVLREDYGLKFSDFAILVRYNRQCEYYRCALREFLIPVGEEEGGVKVETVHASKGLQYPVVFYAGLAEGLTPGELKGSRKERKKALAEERRLFYVGVTRAEAMLLLLYCRRRFWKGKQVEFKPSRFLRCVEPPPKDSRLPLFLFKILVAARALAYMAFAILQITARRLFAPKTIDEWLERRVQEFAAFCMKILRIELSIENQAVLAKVDWARPVIIVSNHQSYVDIPVIFLALNRKIGFLAKYDLKRIPFLNYWMIKLGCHFVKRSDKRGGLAAQEEMLEAKDIRIVVFPEGSRSKDGTLKGFKSGGFRLAAGVKATLVPIVIRGTRATWEGRKGTKVEQVRATLLEPLDLAEVGAERGEIKIRDYLIPEVRSRMEAAL